MNIALTTLLVTHVALSLVGIGAGAVVLGGLLRNRRLDRWTAVFLSTTVATSVTGFMFPADRFLPSHAFGIVSLVVLAVAIEARYRRHLAGGWRLAYVIPAMVAFYLNSFVLVAQSFLKVPALRALAPTQAEPPFAIAQLALLVAFAWLTWLAAVRFQGGTDGSSRSANTTKTVIESSENNKSLTGRSARMTSMA